MKKIILLGKEELKLVNGGKPCKLDSNKSWAYQLGYYVGLWLAH